MEPLPILREKTPYEKGNIAPLPKDHKFETAQSMENTDKDDAKDEKEKAKVKKEEKEAEADKATEKAKETKEEEKKADDKAAEKPKEEKKEEAKAPEKKALMQMWGGKTFNEQVEDFGDNAIRGSMQVSNLHEKRDIKDDNVNPDVYDWSFDNLMPIPWNRYDSPEDKRNAAPMTSAAQIQAALAEAMAIDEQEPEPEKVHILEPEVYRERANNNKPNPRTTFYDSDYVVL